MSPEEVFAAIREIGNFLLLSMPGFLVWLTLPPARALHPAAASANWRSRTVVWVILTTLLLATLMGYSQIDSGLPGLRRTVAVGCSILATGILYVWIGGDHIADALTRCNRLLLKLSGSLALVCALATLANVIMRHVFAIGFGWTRETVIYCYAACFMLGAAGTLARDGHVRIDILRGRMSQTLRARLEIFGSLCLLMPVMALILNVYAPQLALSWGAGSGQLETSDEGDGLPLAFAFKTLIPVFAITMIAQGWAVAWRASADVLVRPSAEDP